MMPSLIAGVSPRRFELCAAPVLFDGLFSKVGLPFR